MAIRNQAKAHPPTICAALAEKQCQPEAVLEHIGEGDDVIVGMFNSEPLTVLDALEAGAGRLSGVRIHQMFPHRERRYMHGVFPGLRHVSWFLSPANREAFHRDTCGLAPGSPRLLLARHPRRLRGVPDRGSPLLRRGEPPDAPNLRREPGTYQPGRRVVRGRLPACSPAAAAAT